MAKIFCSMSGDGRGHATRVRAVVGILRQRHGIHILAPGDAYDLLAPIFDNSDVVVEKISGLRSQFSPTGKLDYIKTTKAAFVYLFRLPRLRNNATGFYRCPGCRAEGEVLQSAIYTGDLLMKSLSLSRGK